MAAGGDVQSFKNVPDKDFDHACTPCGVGDTKTEAVKYCAECREYLCIGCSKHHGWQRATHSHNLLDKDAAKKHPVATTPPKCHYHPDRDIDMYCERHEKVCCTRCIDTEHRYCFGVMFIEEMKRAFTNDSQTELLQNKVTKLHDRLSDINKREQEFTDSLECQRRDILQIIQADERGFIEHLTKLKAELTDMLDKKQREFKDEHRSEIRKVTDIIKKLREAKDDLKNISSVREMETTEKCVLLRRVQNTVADAEQFYDEWEFKGKNELRLKKIEGSLFQTNLTLTTCKKMVTLGQICQVVEPRNRMCELKSMENPDLETNIYYINDLCVLQDGTIMLADNANKVHWLDANYRVKDYCNLGASPTSI